MSMASEWAAARQKRVAALEIERQNIRREIEEPENPGCGRAYLVESGGKPSVSFGQYGMTMDTDEAVAVARWILDVFGETPRQVLDEKIPAASPASDHSDCLRVGDCLLSYCIPGKVIAIDRSDARGAVLTLRATDGDAGPISD